MRALADLAPRNDTRFAYAPRRLQVDSVPDDLGLGLTMEFTKTHETDFDRVCVDCSKIPPETETPYTLISSQHGWRLVFENLNGKRTPVWRCPSCWQRYRNK